MEKIQKAYKKTLVFGVFFLFYANSIPAQTDTIKAIFDSLVITASRLPHASAQTSSYITPPLLTQLQQAGSINELIQGAPGIFALSAHNYAQDTRITSRGFGARSPFGIRGIKIWVDEIPETTPDGQSQLDNVDFSSIQSIEILRGPNAALYGNVSGAMIKINTAEPQNIKSKLSLRFAMGSYGFKQTGLRMFQQTGNWKLQANYNYHEINGYREWSAFRNHIFNAKANYTSGAHLLKLWFNGVHNPMSQDAGALTREEVLTRPKSARSVNPVYNAGEQLDQYRISGIYRYKGKTNYYQLKSYYLTRNFDNQLGFQSGGMVHIDRQAYAMYAEAGSLNTSGFHSWIGGIDLQFQRDKRSNYNNLNGVRGDVTLDQKEKYDDVSSYILNRFKWHSKWSTELNLRYSLIRTGLHDRFLIDGEQSGNTGMQALNPAINLRYQINAQFSSKIQFATGFESPTLLELLVSPSTDPGLNRSLKPSKTNGLEAQVHWQETSGAKADLQLYQIHGSDEIISYEVVGQPGRFYHQNTGRSLRRGVEFSALLPIKKAIDLLVTHNSVYTQNIFNKSLPGIPENTTQAQIVGRINKKLAMRLEFLWVDKIPLNDAGTDFNNAYAETSLQGSYELPLRSMDLTITSGINNLFDASYFSNLRINAAGKRYYEMAPGRNFWFAILFNFDKK